MHDGRIYKYIYQLKTEKIVDIFFLLLLLILTASVMSPKRVPLTVVQYIELKDFLYMFSY